MHVICIALGDGHRRAGRMFPGGEEVALEVVKVTKTVDGKEVETGDDPPGSVGPNGRLKPDATIIGTRSYEEIRKDPRIKVLADGETQGMTSAAALDAARSEAGKMAAALSDATIKIAALEADNAALAKENDELKAKLEAVGKAKK